METRYHVGGVGRCDSQNATCDKMMWEEACGAGVNKNGGVIATLERVFMVFTIG